MMKNLAAKVLYSCHFLGHLEQNSYYFLAVYTKMFKITL